MFYNFNRHKQKAAQVANPQADDLFARFAKKFKAWQRFLADQLTKKISVIPIFWQKAIFLAMHVFGMLYCLWLTNPDSHRKKLSDAYHTWIGKSSAIRAITLTPKQKAFEYYLDSLERAFITDSIHHSQQNTNAHADTIIQP